MSEKIAPTATPEPVTPTTADADAAFGAAFAAVGDVSGDGGSDEPEPEAAVDPETATDPAPEKPGDAPWTVQQARRYRKQADRRLAEANEREQAAKAQSARIEDLARQVEARDVKLRELEHALDRDPDAALAAIAARAGMDPERWYEQMTIRRANGGAPGGTELLDRLDRLEKQLQGERQERAQREQQYHQQQAAQVADAELHEATLKMVGIREDERMARKWPHAASLPEAELYARARVELAHRLQTTSGPVILDDIVEAIEREAKPLAETIRSSRWLQQQAAVAPVTAPSNGRRRSVPTARDATGQGAPREMTRQEREAAADAVFAAAFARDT